VKNSPDPSPFGSAPASLAKLMPSVSVFRNKQSPSQMRIFSKLMLTEAATKASPAQVQGPMTEGEVAPVELRYQELRDQESVERAEALKDLHTAGEEAAL